MRFLGYFLKYGVLSAVILLVFANTVLMQASRGRMYDDIRSVPYNYVGLLLGTSPFMQSTA